jgi:peroxiredoxin
MKRLWLRAREGTLRVGDRAPAFDLTTFDKRSRVTLASLRGKPAVLVFGSYT